VGGGSSNQVIDQTARLVHFRAGSLTACPLGGDKIVIRFLVVLLVVSGCAVGFQPKPQPVLPAQLPANIEPSRSAASCTNAPPAESAPVEGPWVLATALPPAPAPSSLKGRTFEVRFYVTATGEVDLGRTIVGIELPAGYHDEFLKTLAMWSFAPAVQDGCAVPGTTTARITL
jgi:hypothetical protein